jgi:hypothetical protein
MSCVPVNFHEEMCVFFHSYYYYYYYHLQTVRSRQNHLTVIWTIMELKLMTLQIIAVWKVTIWRDKRADDVLKPVNGRMMTHRVSVSVLFSLELFSSLESIWEQQCTINKIWKYTLEQQEPFKQCFKLGITSS